MSFGKLLGNLKMETDCHRRQPHDWRARAFRLDPLQSGSEGLKVESVANYQ